MCHPSKKRIGAIEIGRGPLGPAWLREIPIRRTHGIARPDSRRFEDARQPIEAWVTLGEDRLGKRGHLLLHHHMGRDGGGESQKRCGLRQVDEPC
jgi:hypothetical protein